MMKKVEISVNRHRLNKDIKYYILFIVLIIYHCIGKTWWTPALYYAGTYLTILFHFWDKFKTTKNWNYIKLGIYFGLIGLYLSGSINPDIKIFLENLSTRKYALGFGGIGIVILMFFKIGKKT